MHARVLRRVGAVLFSTAAAWTTPTRADDYPACGTYSTTSEFQLGEFVNLKVVNDELQINTIQDTTTANPPVLPYVWMACSNRGTAVRIATAYHYSEVHKRNVDVGEILGEYRTAPDDCWSGSLGNPSRTTVDFDGNVWVANRSDTDNAEPGHVVKIGTGLAFQWVDRNCNGALDTSRGLDDVLLWSNPDAACTDDDVRFAQDELILLYKTTPTEGTRTVAVDRENNVWIGGRGRIHEGS